MPVISSRPTHSRPEKLINKNKTQWLEQVIGFYKEYGGNTGIRTWDPIIMSDVL